MKRIINRQRFSLLILGMMLISLLIAVAPTQASISTTYYENFTDEANNTNPVSSTAEGAWYTYAESHFLYSNVNGSNAFLINNSATGVVGSYANFTFASLPTGYSNMDTYTYDQFIFQFTYYNNMRASAKRNHSGIEFRLRGATYDICTVYVYGLNNTVAANRDRIVITNYSGAVKVNRTVQDGFRYGVSYEPDYDANTITVTLRNESAGSAVLNTTTITLMGETNILKFYMTNHPATTTPVYISLDSFTIEKTVPSYSALPGMEQMIAIVAIPAILITALLFLIISGNFATPEGMVSLLVIILLAFVTLSFLYA